MLFISLGHIRQPVNQLDIELKIAKILVGLIGAWMITWTPYAIVALIGISGHGHLLTVILWNSINHSKY